MCWLKYIFVNKIFIIWIKAWYDMYNILYSLYINKVKTIYKF